MTTEDRNDPALRIKLKDGQNAAHIVLSDDERAQGFVRPVRDAYKHTGKLIQRNENGSLYGILVKIDDPEFNDYDGTYTADKGWGRIS